MKKQSRFLFGSLAVAGIVGYLMITGMRDSMVYYYTPPELLAKVSTDPTFHEVPVKVGARVVPGTVAFDPRTLDLSFEAVDIPTGEARFRVHYQGPLPDTFEEGRDVVVEGRYSEAGVFEATILLTKCGSRYEAAEEDFRA